MNHKDYHYTYNSVFASDLDEYITLKRSSGLYYRVEAAVLRQFDRLCCEHNLSDMSNIDDILTEWVTPRLNEKVSTRGSRISTLKSFIKFINCKYDNIIKWSPTYKYSADCVEFVPYIFTKNEIDNIFAAADQFPTCGRTQFNIIFPAILRTMYACGLRVSEALMLESKDVDLFNNTLTIRNSKFDNSRLVPISDSLKKYLLKYRENLKCSADCKYFFPNPQEYMYSPRTVYDKFRTVLWSAGISHGGRGKGPRLHDFRHTFAVHSLHNCVLKGIDIYVFLPVLATYLGHSKISTTEKYLRLTPDIFPNLLQMSEVISDTIIPEVHAHE